MLRLTILRSRPQQGQPVKVYVFGEQGKCGELLLSFQEWIQLNKTLKEGIESLTRKHELQMELPVKPLEDANMGDVAPVITSESVRSDIVGRLPIKKELTEEEVAQALRNLERETNDL